MTTRLSIALLLLVLLCPPFAGAQSDPELVPLKLLTTLERTARDLARAGVTAEAVIRVDSAPPVHLPEITPLARARARTLLLWLDAKPAADFLETLEAAQSELPRFSVLASTRLDDREFLERAGARAEGLTLPMLREALGYEMVRVIAAAARQAGLQPQRLREALGSA